MTRKVKPSEIPVGQIIKLAGTKSSPYRKVYKIVGNHVWGILMSHHWAGDKPLTEDCGMTENHLSNLREFITVDEHGVVLSVEKVAIDL